VAMKNGLDYIKDKAKYVSEKTNNESGVADFINKFVL
jgi:hydroxymethylpyrimidine pyrophosphatase-like HAD family hydrolase